MGWKKLIENKEIISYEVDADDFKIRIEARAIENGEWAIFKRYYDGKDVNFTEEFLAKNNDERDFLLNRLKESQFPTKKELKSKSSEFNQDFFFRIERIISSEYVEKWKLIHNKFSEGFVTLINNDDNYFVDIIVDKRAAYLEDKIIEFIEKTFNLDTIDETINYNIVFTDKVSRFSVDTNFSDFFQN